MTDEVPEMRQSVFRAHKRHDAGRVGSLYKILRVYKL